jgi:hypothetical protein
MIRQFLRDLPLDPAIDFLEDRVSPIFIKEIRLIFREKLFVIAYNLTLAAMALTLIVVLLAWYNPSGRPVDASELGVQVHTILQVMQLVAVALILPGATATLITTEREAGTFDMLLSASMSPRKILWGKLLASLSVTFVLVISVLPLSLATPMLGGVDLGHVFRWYLTLALLSLLMANLSLCISSVARSAAQAIISSYTAGIGLVLVVFLLGVLFEDWGIREYAATLWGFAVPEYIFPGVFSGTGQEVLLGLVLPLCTVALLIALLATSALYSITPPHPLRPAPIKILFLLAGLAAEGLAALAAGQQPGSTDVLQASGVGLALALSLASAFVLDDVLFPAEPRRSPFRAGSANGLFYSWLAVAALSGGFGVFFSNWPLALAMAGWGIFCGGLAFVLRASMPGVQGARTLHLCLLGVLMGLPLILEAVAPVTASPRDLNPYALVSPLLFALAAARHELDWALYFPLAASATGIVLTLLGWPLLSRRRLQAEESSE